MKSHHTIATPTSVGNTQDRHSSAWSKATEVAFAMACREFIRPIARFYLDVSSYSPYNVNHKPRKLGERIEKKMTLDAQRREELIDRFARRVVQMGMTAPAILFLEGYKPLSFLGAQLLWVSGPFLSLLIDARDLRDFTKIIEDEAGTEALIERLESLQHDHSSSNLQHR